jgi:alpha-mannosidase
MNFLDKPVVYVTQHNHFDPVWHRCWDRSYDFRGKRYRSYADLEELVFDIWLENAKRGTALVEGQSAVLRKYLERNPDRVDEIQELVDNGQIEFMAGGETVSDTNIPSGETLLRNLILGQTYFAETFGIIPTVGTLEDAFGHCAQMPQLFRGIGCKMIHAICRVRVPGDYWKGLDGSVVFIGGMPGRHAGHCSKIPPCPECAGMGCEACDFRGLAREAEITDDAIMAALREGFQPGLTSIMNVGGEEAVPNPRLPELIEQAAQSLGLDLRHG